MLLACPNCDARYEVPDSAIPENGRDVQCSNCGHAWFQLPDHASAQEPEDNPVADSALSGASPALNQGPDSSDIDEDTGSEQNAPETGMASPRLSGTDALKAALAGRAVAEAAAPAVDIPPAEEAANDVQPAGASPAPRRSLDDSVLAILRDEADREASARKLEAQRNTNRRAEAETGLQSQPEFPMPPPTPEMIAQQKRLAMLRGEDQDDSEPEPARPPSRRDLLPDVEEINSTLQSDDTRPDLDDEVDSLPDLTRGGFRSGFLLAMLVLIIASLVYIFASQISAAVPALEPGLQSYVSFVDSLRHWLNSMMDNATRALTGDAADAG